MIGEGKEGNGVQTSRRGLPILRQRKIAFYVSGGVAIEGVQRVSVFAVSR